MHSPETALNDQFQKDSWDEYIRALETSIPELAGVGVTDYFSTEGYRKVRDEQRLRSRLEGVLLFPNIEMRLSITTKTAKAVNIHLLVSPEDPDHLEKINEKLAALTCRFLNEDYPCTADGLRRLGRAWHAHKEGKSKQEVRAGVGDVGALRMGANQFKVDFTGLTQWRDKDPWIRANTLLAVPNGNDGAGGVATDASFAAMREQLRHAAHIILTSNPGDRDYWLGRGADAPTELERKYGGIKPCLTGSDAHDLERINNPGDRLCWIKAEPTWRGFLQTLVEPEERAFVGARPPERPRTNWIQQIHTTGQEWCPKERIDLNPGLVTVIGPRGSGKTALADLLAYGAQAYSPGPASFLSNARKFVAKTAVDLAWGDGSSTKEQVDPAHLRLPRFDAGGDADAASGTDTHGGVLYLSQHFVESLCASGTGRDRLREEIERVVFERLDSEARLSASTFPELLDQETSAIREDSASLTADIDTWSHLIAEEYALELTVPDIKRRIEAVDVEIKQIDASLKANPVPKAAEKQAAVSTAQEQFTALQSQLNSIAVRIKTVEDVKIEVQAASRDAVKRTAGFLTKLRSAFPALSEAQAAAFRIAFAGDVDAILEAVLHGLKNDASTLRGMEGGSPAKGTLLDLRAKLDSANKALRSAGALEKQTAELIKSRSKKADARRALESQLQKALGAKDRIVEHRQERLAFYRGVIDNLVAEEGILKRLYGTLQQDLDAMDGIERRFALQVRREADLGSWIAKGERLFDFRKRHVLTEPGMIRQLAEELLMPCWEGNGDPVVAITAFQDRLRQVSGIRDCFAGGVTLEDFARWLFSTDHIRVSYAPCLDGVDIDRLSPGARGVEHDRAS